MPSFTATYELRGDETQYFIENIEAEGAWEAMDEAIRILTEKDLKIGEYLVYKITPNE